MPPCTRVSASGPRRLLPLPDTRNLPTCELPFRISPGTAREGDLDLQFTGAANLRTKILDFRGFDLSRISILTGGILISIGNLLDISSQQNLAGRILVGRLGAALERRARRSPFFRYGTMLGRAGFALQPPPRLRRCCWHSRCCYCYH